MYIGEKETIITINDADMREGFFYFGTSKRHHYDRIKKLLKEEHIVEEKIHYHGAAPSYWSMKLRSDCLTKRGFSIRPPRTYSDSQREIMRKNAAKLSEYHFKAKN